MRRRRERGGHRRLKKEHVRGCAQHHEPERNKRVRHALTQRRKTDETAAFQRACFAMSSACMPLHRGVDDSEHEESAMMVAGEFCEVEKHPLPAGGAVESERERENLLLRGVRRRAAAAIVAARLCRAVRILQTRRREHPKKRRSGFSFEQV